MYVWHCADTFLVHMQIALLFHIRYHRPIHASRWSHLPRWSWCASSHYSSHWTLGIKHLPHIHKEESRSSTCYAVWSSCSPTSYWTLTSFPIFWYLTTSFHSTPLNFSFPHRHFLISTNRQFPSLLFPFLHIYRYYRTTLPSMDIFLASFSRHTVPGGLCVHLFMPFT